MSDSIHIHSAEKRVEVGGNGDFITLDVGNTTFMGNLIGLIGEFEASSASVSEMLSKAENSVDEVSAAIKHASDVCGKLVVRTDEVFGAGTCKKVFGDRAPGIYEFADFFTQIGALLKKYSAERDSEIEEKIAKYKAKYNGGGGD